MASKGSSQGSTWREDKQSCSVSDQWATRLSSPTCLTQQGEGRAPMIDFTEKN